MKVGNKKTLWYKKTCFQQCEHSVLNQIGDQYLLGNITKQEAIVRTSDILLRYKEEADRHRWDYFGVKITHAVQSKTWPLFHEIFDQVWKNPVYVTSIRDPEGIVHSTRNNPKWTERMIINSILDSEPAIRWIEDNGVPFYFPKDWRNGMLEVKIRDIGLEWNEEALALLDVDRIYDADMRGLYA
jgi:hypothetical protein